MMMKQKGWWVRDDGRAEPTEGSVFSNAPYQRDRWARPRDGDDPPKPDPRLAELETKLAETTAAHEAAVAQRDALTLQLAAAQVEFTAARARLKVSQERDIKQHQRATFVSLLEVLDNLDRAVDAAQEDDPMHAGIVLVQQQFLAKLAGFGVERIDCVGATFDPTRHEAVTRVPITDGDGCVLFVFAHGYRIGDDVLRPAMVSVGVVGVVTCEHEWQEQPGEPPVDVCSSCGAVRR